MAEWPHCLIQRPKGTSSDTVREEQHNTQRLSDSEESAPGNDDTQVELLRWNIACHEFSSVSLANSNHVEDLEHW